MPSEATIPGTSELDSSNLRADYLLPSLPNSIHRSDTIAYRIEQLDELEKQQLQHTTWNSCRLLDFRPCASMRSWLWSSERRTHSLQYHYELEWPENDGVSRHLSHQVFKARIFTSPINFHSLINLPNAKVNRNDDKAQKLAPSFYRFSTDDGFQILDQKSE